MPEGHLVLIVENDSDNVEDLAEGRVACPACGGVLARWSFARRRHVRTEEGPTLIRPRRGRCLQRTNTQVLLPDVLVWRRVDSIAVIGRALNVGLAAPEPAAACGRGGLPPCFNSARTGCGGSGRWHHKWLRTSQFGRTGWTPTSARLRHQAAGLADGAGRRSGLLPEPCRVAPRPVPSSVVGVGVERGDAARQHELALEGSVNSSSLFSAAGKRAEAPKGGRKLKMRDRATEVALFRYAVRSENPADPALSKAERGACWCERWSTKPTPALTAKR